MRKPGRRHNGHRGRCCILVYRHSRWCTRRELLHLLKLGGRAETGGSRSKGQCPASDGGGGVLLVRGSRCPTRGRWPSLGATPKPARWSARLPPGTLVPMQTRGLPGTARRFRVSSDRSVRPPAISAPARMPLRWSSRFLDIEPPRPGRQADRRPTDARTVQQARSTARPESRCRPTMCCAGGARHCPSYRVVKYRGDEPRPLGCHV